MASSYPFIGQPSEAWLSSGGIGANGVRYAPPKSATAWGAPGCPLLPRVLREQRWEVRLPSLFDQSVGASLTVGQLDSDVLHRFNVPEVSDSTRRALRDFLYASPPQPEWIAIPAGIPLLWVEALPIAERTRNAVRRAFKTAGSDGYFHRPIFAMEFMTHRLVGMMTLNELTCVIESTELDSASCEQLIEPNKFDHLLESKGLKEIVNVAALQLMGRVSSVAGQLNTFARWALAETGARTVGDAIIELNEASTENEEWNAIAAVSLFDIAEVPQHPYAVLDDWAEQLDTRARAVFWERLCRSPVGSTLSALADSFGVTRERMRQIEVRTRRSFESFMARDDALPLRWRVKTLRQVLGVARPEEMVERLLMAPPGCRDYSSVLLEMAGPYVRDHGWLILESVRQFDPTPTIVDQADEVGRIDEGMALLKLTEWGLDDSLHRDWLTRNGTLRLFNGQLVRWGASIPDRLAFALADLGYPATVDELVDHVGEKGVRSSVINALSSDTRLVRVDRTRWALSSWSLPEYTGVANVIRSLLERSGQSIAIDEIVQLIDETFGVSENTTRAYCNSPMFVVEGESLRMRTDADEPFRSDIDSIKRTPGVFRLGPRRVGRLLKVDSDMLRGSGTMLSHGAGAVLQVEVNEILTFSNEEGDVVTVTFPESSIVGPSLGSVRRIAERLSAMAGDYLTLVLDRSDMSLAVDLIDLSDHQPGWDVVSRLTGISAPTSWDSLAAALGCANREVGSLLRERGDVALVEYLPETPSSTSLDQALAVLESQIQHTRE